MPQMDKDSTSGWECCNWAVRSGLFPESKLLNSCLSGGHQELATDLISRYFDLILEFTF